MCRLAAYSGPSIPLERIVILPQHSLLQQSQQANEAKLAVNGDGFGIAWYGDENEIDPRPGLYRDVLPAWSDGNLTSICRMTKSRLFLAHVRASTFGETSRSNCHPFSFQNWSFMHNGQIAGFGRIQRQLEATLPDELYDARRGTTDSELFFLLCLSHGLAQSPKQAIEQAISQIRNAQKERFGELSQPNRMACVMSDGENIIGFRTSTDKKSPTLYASGELTSGGKAIASEPLDGSNTNWTSINEGEFIQLSNGQFTHHKLDV